MKSIHYILLLLLMILLSSCASQYIPPASFVPLLENKNDLKVEGALSTNSLHTGIAYSPINHFAIMTNGNISNNYFMTKHDVLAYYDGLYNSYLSYLPIPARHLYYEAALGYYNKIGNNVLYEFYFGYGRGHTTFYEHYYVDATYHGIYMKPYATMNVAYSNSLISFGLSFTGAYCNYSMNGYRNSNFYGYVTYSDSYMFNIYETYLFGKARTENIELGVKIGRIFTSDYYDIDKIRLDNTRYHISFSASYLFKLSEK